MQSWATNGFSVFEKVLGKEEDVCGTFGEATHEVRIPFVAEGDVDAHTVALLGEGSLEVAANSVKHLEFEVGEVDVALLNELSGGLDHGVVVGGDAVIDAALDEQAHETDEVGIDVGFYGEGDLGRFLICALAEPNANAVAEKLTDIFFATVKVGLNHDANMAGVGYSIGVAGVEALDDVESDLCEG